MNCQYCRAQNDSDDHRCHRCGRRLPVADNAPPARFPVTMTSAAPDLAPSERAEPTPITPIGPQLVPPPVERPVEAERKHPPAAFQASLFGPQEVGRPTEPVRRSQPAQPSAGVPKVDRSAQRSLQFDAMPEGPRSNQSSVESAIYCNAEVAVTPLRMISAGVDLFVPLMGLFVFFATLKFSGHSIEWSMQSVPYLLAIAGLIVIFYRLLFCLGNGDTPGVIWTGLRVINFDGHRPTRQQRLHRLAGSLVSIGAAGLGLLWAAVDEERLTWHDHMSQTFVTMAR